MTREYQLILDAQKELNKAVWAGDLKYADEGNFDDLETRDKFVMTQIAITLKALEKYVSKVRPIQNNRRVIKQKKNIFN